MFFRKRIISGVGGFTLMEIMVVVAIAGILASIAIPAYLSWKPGYVLRGAVSQVRADLNRAKMRAVETRRECGVVFSAIDYQIFDGKQARNTDDIDWGNIDANGIFTDDTPWRELDFKSYPGVTLTGNAVTAGSVPTIAFSPRGTATKDDTFNIVQQSTGKSAVIEVNINGRINIRWL